MHSLSPARFVEPEFLRLSERAQQYLRAMWKTTEVLREEGGDPSKPGEPGPEFETVGMRAALAEVERVRAMMTETEGEEMSAYAHRCDYPEMYEDGKPTG